MSKLISGKEALIALANGKEVEYQAMDKNFYPLQDFLDSAKIRLKPKTITINGIEVVKPTRMDWDEGEYPNSLTITFNSKLDTKKAFDALSKIMFSAP